MKQFEITSAYIDNLKVAIKNGNSEEVRILTEHLHPADIAEILEELSVIQGQFLYGVLDKEIAAEAVMELDEDIREAFLSTLSSEQIARQYIDNLDSDDAADLILELPENVQDEVLSHLDNVEQASDIADLLNYDEHTAGGLMAKELVKVNLKWNVLKCVREMRRQAEEVSNVYSVYVVDDSNILHGLLSLKKLLISPAKTKVEDIYTKDVVSVRADIGSEEVANVFKKYSVVVVPVVDNIGRLVGRITVDDIVHLMTEEAEKDYQLMSGITENIESTDKVLVISRARLPWLLIALVGGVVASRIITQYEGEIQVHPEMAFFMPLIAAMGGNVGIQSSALIVQGLANNSLSRDGIVPKLLKELAVGLFNGLICSVFLLSYNMLFSDSLALSFTVSIALLVVIVFAALFGSFVPLALDKWNIDPALATGPFITTSNDIIGLFIYFMIGRAMYGMF